MDAALASGYYDQAHLIRDCKDFSGETPAALLAPEADLARHFLSRFGMSHSYNTPAGGSSKLRDMFQKTVLFLSSLTLLGKPLPPDTDQPCHRAMDPRQGRPAGIRVGAAQDGSGHARNGIAGPVSRGARLRTALA